MSPVPTNIALPVAGLERFHLKPYCTDGAWSLVLLRSDDVAAGLAPDGVVRVLLAADSAEHSVHLQRKSRWRFIKGIISGLLAQWSGTHRSKS